MIYQIFSNSSKFENYIGKTWLSSYNRWKNFSRSFYTFGLRKKRLCYHVNLVSRLRFWLVIYCSASLMFVNHVNNLDSPRSLNAWIFFLAISVYKCTRSFGYCSFQKLVALLNCCLVVVTVKSSLTQTPVWVSVFFFFAPLDLFS